MKKVLIGCAIFFLIVVVLTVGCTVYIGMKFSKWTTAIAESAESIQLLETDFPFEEPAGAETIDPNRYQEYLAVRQRLMDSTVENKLIGMIVDSIENDTQPDIGFGEFMGLIKDIPKIMGSYEETFREYEMSPSEYAYMVRETLRAIQQGAEQGDPEMQELWNELTKNLQEAQAAIQQQQAQGNQNIDIDLQGEMERIESEEAPAENVQLVKENIEHFKANPLLLIIELVVGQALSQMMYQM